MVINKLKIASIICLLGIALSGCIKDLTCGFNNTYSFDITVQAYPDKDSIHIGDTIWFQMNSPVKLKDEILGDTINFSGAVNLGMNIGINKLVALEDSINWAANDFKYLPIYGTETPSIDNNQFRLYLPAEINGEYKFLLGLIPIKTGVFEVGFSNPSHVFRKSDVCTKAAFTLNFTNTNQHQYYIKIVNPGYDPPIYQGGNAYFFKVI